MKTYTTETLIEQYLLLSIDASYTSQVASWIDGISLYIDKYTDRTFDVPDELTTRVYDGSGTDRLVIDNCFDIDEVNIDEVETTDYFKYPTNSTVVDWLELEGDIFTRGKQNIEVVAKFGYPAIPNDVRHAATVLTAAIILAQTNQQGEVASEKIGDYTVSYKDDNHRSDVTTAMINLSQYKRYQV